MYSPEPTVHMLLCFYRTNCFLSPAALPSSIGFNVKCYKGECSSFLTKGGLRQSSMQSTETLYSPKKSFSARCLTTLGSLSFLFIFFSVGFWLKHCQMRGTCRQFKFGLLSTKITHSVWRLCSKLQWQSHFLFLCSFTRPGLGWPSSYIMIIKHASADRFQHLKCQAAFAWNLNLKWSLQLSFESTGSQITFLNKDSAACKSII